MTLYTTGAGWDRSRNSSATFQPSPWALSDALRACERFRAAHPAHARWIEDGAPGLTDDEHWRRFGHAYEPRRRVTR